MGKQIQNQIASGIYPTRQEFEKYYIIDNHSILETAQNFGLTRNIVLNLITYFNLHKCGEYSIVRDYPELDNLIAGGYSQLLEYFLTHYMCNKLTVRCDFNKYNGSIYSKLGFNFIEYTGPQKKAITSNFKNQYSVYDAGYKIYILKNINKQEGDSCD